MRNSFLVFIGLFCFSSVCLAETLSYPSYPGGYSCVLWDNITNADINAIDVANWPGGKMQIEVNGTIEDAEFEIYHTMFLDSDTKSVDSDAANNGLSFTSATKLISVIELTKGFATINFSSGSANLAIDVKACPVIPRKPL